jgi:hypothetical protein
MSRRWVLRHTPRRVVLVGPVVACCACGWLCATLDARRSTLVVGSVAVLAAFFGGYGWQVLWRAYRLRYRLRCWLDPGGDSPPAHTYGANAGRGSGSLRSGGAYVVADLGYCVGECAASLPVVNDCAALVCEA